MACRAVIEAASRFNRFFSGQMTAAGRVPPAKVRLQPWNTHIPKVLKSSALRVHAMFCNK